jgi:hypothetical protein
MTKKVLFIGSRDLTVIDQVKKAFEGNEEVVVDVQDRSIMNYLEDRAKQRVIDWKEKQAISVYIRVPENYNNALAQAEKMYHMLKELKAIERYHELLAATGKELDEISNIQLQAMKDEAAEGWNGWFSLKDVVEATDLNYKDAKQNIDSLFAFGFIASRDLPETKLYTLLLNDEMIITHLELLAKENDEINKQYKAAIKAVKAKGKKTTKSAVETPKTDETQLS